MRGVALVLLGSLLTAGPVWSASFDCAKARTPQEKAICADSKLSTLDSETAAAYKGLLWQLSPGAATQVKSDQEAWLKWRDAACAAQPAPAGPSLSECLSEVYTDQLTMLRSARRVQGVMFYPRLELETIPEKRNMTPGYDDPGLGVGRFAWLAVDRPDAQQAAWNAAMRARVVATSNMQMNASGPPPVSFNPKGIEGGTFTVNTVLHAANSRYISTELDAYSYFYGGAHGGSTRMPFQWWVEKQRPLAVQDIFGSGTAWRQPFADLCFQTLMHGPERQELFLNAEGGGQLFTKRSDIDNDSLTFSNWLVDGSGITVLYGEYAIAPYAAGIVTAHLPWSALRPWLAPGFDPGALPQPLPGGRMP